MTEFEKAIAKNIKTAIAAAKKDGVVGMSLDNLRQVTKTPAPYGLEGTPSGPSGYRAVFAKVASEMKGAAQWAY